MHVKTDERKSERRCSVASDAQAAVRRAEVVAVVEHVLAPVRLPAGVVRLVSEVADAHLALELAQVAPRLVILQASASIKRE